MRIFLSVLAALIGGATLFCGAAFARSFMQEPEFSAELMGRGDLRFLLPAAALAFGACVTAGLLVLRQSLPR